MAYTLLDEESFESSLGDWTNDPSNVSDWVRHSGGTGSNSTGPSSAYDGSWYIYIETSSSGSNDSGDTDIIEYDIGETKDGYVDFYYHQYGTNQGTLYLEGYDGSSWTEIWSSTGNQGDQWNNVTTTDSDFSGYSKLRFRNVADGGYRGDVALDLIKIYVTEVIVTVQNATSVGGDSARLNGTVTDDGDDSGNVEARFRYRETVDNPISLTDEESFETNLGDWVNDAGNVSDWIRNENGTGSGSTGPSSAYDGDWYIYIETSSGDSYDNGDTDIIVYDIGTTEDGYVDFYYHQYGTDQGTLYLEGYDGSTWNEIWSSTGDQGNQWNHVESDETEFSGYSKLRFRNVAAGGYRGDIALDLVKVYTGDLPLSWNYTSWQNSLSTSDTFYKDITGLDVETEYEFQAQGRNTSSEGDWSSSLTFETVLAEPGVSTDAATSIEEYSFQANGEITDVGAGNPHTRGFCWIEGNSGEPDTTDNKVEDNGGGSYSVGTYSKTIDGLSRETSYRVRAYAINSEGTGYGDTITVTTDDGWVYSSWQNTLSTSDIYYKDIAGLESETEYEFQAQAKNGGGEGDWSNISTFTTLAPPPTVEMVEIDNITHNSSRAKGEVTDDAGDSNNVEARFRYKKTGAAVWTETAWQNSLSTNDEYTENLSGLDPDTEYEVQTQGRNVNGEGDWSSSLTFFTYTEIPVVDIDPATNIDKYSFTANGEITNEGAATVTRRGFCYLEGDTGTPDITDNVIDETGTFIEEPYSLEVSGLSSETSYRVRAFAENSEGIGYSDTTITVTTIEAWEYTTWQPNLNTNDEFYEDLTELDSDIEYEFQVQVRCGTTEYDWTSSEYFTTLALARGFAWGYVLAG